MARQIGDLFYAWLVTELQVDREESRAVLAALAFVTIEGFVFIDAIGGDAIIQEALEAITTNSAQ